MLYGIIYIIIIRMKETDLIEEIERLLVFHPYAWFETEHLLKELRGLINNEKPNRKRYK